MSSGVLDVRGSLLPAGVRATLRNFSLTDGQLALLVSAVLFVLGAWPLALTEIPPYQDLPNHLATLTVIRSPERYPEFVFNGFFKTNAALFAWLYLVGKVTGAAVASKLFALLVLAGNAFVLPRFVLHFTKSRRKMLVASLFAWPMVHNWFVSMGMLDFALSVPLSFAALLLLDVHLKRPSVKTGLAIVALGALTWYAHVFPLLVVFLLVAIESFVRQKTWAARFTTFRTMALPLVPASLLVVVSLGLHFSTANGGLMTGFVEYRSLLPPWELAYNAWSEWFWAYSKMTITSLVPCLVLAGFGIWRRRESPAFFSPLALGIIALLYCFLPYVVTNWFHVNSRMLPYLWMAFLLRLPDRIPKQLTAALGLSAVLYSAGMGADFVRLDRERREFTAGIAAVPEGAQLLPLVFRHKGISENTRNLMHAWGFYVTEKHTAAPLLFAHSRSFPVMYSTPPPVRFNHLVLEGFAPSMDSPKTMCRAMFGGNMVVDDCAAIFRGQWEQFYAEALPRYDHLLTWDITPEARAVLPPEYKLTFEQGRLAIFARRDLTPGPVKAAANDAPSDDANGAR